MNTELHRVIQSIPFPCLAVAADNTILSSSVPGVMAGPSVDRIVVATQRTHWLDTLRTIRETHEPVDQSLQIDGEAVPWQAHVRPMPSPPPGMLLLSLSRPTGDAGRSLEAIIQEKEVLLAEVHHRVKNNMQLISSMLMIQTHYVDDPLFKTVVKECQERIRAMALVHETLYQSNNWSDIDFSAYVTTMLNRLSVSYHSPLCGVTHHIDMAPVRLPIQQAITLGLVVNELITNAYKYAFQGRDRGTITVTLSEGVQQTCVLTVEDNGVGFPTDLELARSQSMGFQLITTLCRQLSADIELEKTNGTRFKLTFRVPSQEVV